MSSDNNRIYEKIDKIDDKLERKFDKIDKRLDSVEKELIVYNEELKHHIEGVNQVKTQNNMMKDYIDIEVQKLVKEFEPIKKHVEKSHNVISGIKTIFTFILKVSGAIGIVLGIYAKYKGIV